MLLAMVDEHHRDRGSSDLGKVNVWSPRIVCQNMPKQSKLLKQFEHVICAQNPWYFRSYRLFDRDPCNGLNIYQNLYKTKSNWIVFYPCVWTKYDETTRNGCSCLGLGYNMAAQNYYYVMFLSTWFHTIPLRCIKLSESIPSYQIAVYHLLWILQRARLEHLPWLKHHRTIQICAPPKHICTPATYQSYHVQYIPMTTNTSDGFSCISVRASGASEYLWVRFASGPPCTAHWFVPNLVCMEHLQESAFQLYFWRNISECWNLLAAKNWCFQK